VEGLKNPDSASVAEITAKIEEDDGNLKIDFISPLFLIQRRKVELEPMEEYLKLVLSLGSSNHDIANYKIDLPAYIDKTAEILGVSRAIVVSTVDAESKKAAVDKARAELEAQNRQAELENKNADTVNKQKGASNATK
jgi:hypothetical protein